MQKTILIVEDEPKLADLLSAYLQQAGYITQHLAEGLAVEPWLHAQTADLLILDLMLPGKDGIEICRAIRTFSSIPIIMATARIEEIDRLLGLELGADDYICKPYSPREVVARVKAILRRVEALKQNSPLDLQIEIDAEAYQIRINQQTLALTLVEFRLLQKLLANPGRVYSRNQLLDSVHEDNRIVTDRTIDTHIKNLRRKLADKIPEREIIKSIYGVGYKADI